MLMTGEQYKMCIRDRIRLSNKSVSYYEAFFRYSMRKETDALTEKCRNALERLERCLLYTSRCV